MASLVPRSTDVNIYSRRLLSVPQVGAMVGLSARTIWNWVYSRRIPVIRIGGTVRIDLAEVERMLDEGTTPALDR